MRKILGGGQWCLTTGGLPEIRPASFIFSINLALVQKKSYFRPMNAHERFEDKLNLLQFSIDPIPDAVYWITMDGRLWNVNSAACGMLGYSREELFSLSVHDIDPEYSREDGQSDLEELKRTGTLHLKRRHTVKDGRVIPVEVTSNYFIYNHVL